jgi:dienelactone hydrolase
MSFSMLIKIAIILSVLFTAVPGGAQESKEDQLLHILGGFPSPPLLQLDTLESAKLEAGWRYKIEYVAEEADTLFQRPADKIRAYLFLPDHEKGTELPAIVAIHQDGPYTHLGKSEPAGVGGDENLYYGLELFERGYVVICPDRYYHAERRRISNSSQAGSQMMRDLGLWLKWAGQLILSGRTHMGKEIYDLTRAVDVLTSYDFVDQDRIGAIGHSAGGNVLVYFMFVDKRVRVGVSSCGFYDLIDDFEDDDQSFSNSVFAIPSLAKLGRSADYLAFLAPRPFLMTRGLNELESEGESKKHVAKAKSIERRVSPRYNQLNAGENFKTIYFEGGHDFPPEVRKQAYQWLDSHLQLK